MRIARLAFGFLLQTMACCVGRDALAQSASDASDVNLRPHRVSAEVGAFRLAKENYVGAAFGLGYGFRPINGLELGLGVRYFVQPERTSDELIPAPAPAPGMPARAPEHAVDPGYHFWLIAVSLRGFLSLDPERLFEVGLSARGGLVSLSERPGFCCFEAALAPDFRVRVLRRTAIALAPEVAISTTGADQSKSEDYVDPIFAYGSVWLSLIQTF